MTFHTEKEGKYMDRTPTTMDNLSKEERKDQEFITGTLNNITQDTF